MTYKDYCSKTRKVKADQLALDKQFIREYPHRNLFGKIVAVTYRWHGKVMTEKVYFEKLMPFFHDVIPVFKIIAKGKKTKRLVNNIYSLNQIIEIKEEAKG